MRHEDWPAALTTTPAGVPELVTPALPTPASQEMRPFEFGGSTILRDVPREETMQNERRRNRSNDLAVALGLQLHYSVLRAHFKSLVLSEELGLLVASAGQKDDLEELAALAPLLAGNQRYWQGMVKTEAGNERITVARVETPFGVFFLSGVAGHGSTILSELLQSGEGVARIVS